MLKQIAKEEQPYEKCMQNGANALSNAELLAVLLRTGTKGKSVLELAQHLLCTDCGEDGILNLHRLNICELKAIKGIGDVKAVQILCISELAKRLAKATAKKNICFQSPSTIADYFMEDMRHHSQEIMKMLLLDTRSNLIGEVELSKGTVNASLISPRELFIEALRKEAVYIVLVHNHPSGDPTPSKEDISFTRQVKKAGDMIGIQLLDHIIIGNHRYISFLNEKLI
jgi:DNA repair protein RadC